MTLTVPATSAHLYNSAPQYDTDATPLTRDGQTLKWHKTRAFSLLDRAYSLSRWEDPTPAKGSEKRAWQAHRRAILHEPTREAISDYRDRKARAFEDERDRRLQWGACTDDATASGPVRDCIAGASHEYGVSHSWLLRIAICESTLNPRAQNPSGASGLFQFMPGTWATTPYGGKSIWSPRWSSLAAAWMFRQGRAGEWACN